jgi:predicted transposase YdaD
MLDKWLFVLKNLTRLFDRPAALQERVFKKLFEQAEIARFTPEEILEYEDSVKIYRDLKNSMDTSYQKGVLNEKNENARKMKALGIDYSIISQVTGLSTDEIDVL